LLKIHKPPFKTLIKSNGIKFVNNVTFEVFDAELKKFQEYE